MKNKQILWCKPRLEQEAFIGLVQQSVENERERAKQNISHH